MESFQESPENFSARGNSHNWHRPYAQSSPPNGNGNGQFQPEQYNPNNIQPSLPSYTNLNIPQHTPTNGPSVMDDVAQSRRRSGSGSGGSEFNSEGGSPNTNATGPPFPVGGPDPSSGGMLPSNQSMPSSPLVEGSSLFQPASGGMEYSAALMSAVSTNNPGLMRQYVQMFGNAAGQRRQRSEKKPIPDEQKDDKYFERRRRNNSAAKRSRAMKKEQNEAMENRRGHLQRVNLRLKAQMDILRPRQAQLRHMMALHDSVLASIDIQAMTRIRQQWSEYHMHEHNDMISREMFNQGGSSSTSVPKMEYTMPKSVRSAEVARASAEFFRNGDPFPKVSSDSAEVFKNGGHVPKVPPDSAEFFNSICRASKDAEMFKNGGRALGDATNSAEFFKHVGLVPKDATNSAHMFENGANHHQGATRDSAEFFKNGGNARKLEYSMPKNTRMEENETDSAEIFRKGGHVGKMQYAVPERKRPDMTHAQGEFFETQQGFTEGGSLELKNKTHGGAMKGTQDEMLALQHMYAGMLRMEGHGQIGIPGAMDLTQSGMIGNGMQGMKAPTQHEMARMQNMTHTGMAGMKPGYAIFGTGKEGNAFQSGEVESGGSDVEDLQ